MGRNLNHTKEHIEDKEQGVDRKQLKNVEESTQGNHLYKKSGNERGHETSENNKKILDVLMENI